MDLFKTLVWDNAIKFFITNVLFRAVPFLSAGPVGFFVSTVLTMLTDAIYKVLKLFIQTEVVVLRNEEQQRAFTKSSILLRDAALNRGIDSQEYKAIHEQEKSALYNLVHFAS